VGRVWRIVEGGGRGRIMVKIGQTCQVRTDVFEPHSCGIAGNTPACHRLVANPDKRSPELTKRRVRPRTFSGMVMEGKRNLTTCSALLGAWLLVPATAAAQPMSDSEKIQKLERQTELLQKQSELLQKQLKEVKKELARARHRSEKVEASGQAVATLPPAPRHESAKSPIVKGPPPPAERVKLTLGGFVTADTVWRQRNMVNDMATNFGAIPYPFSPLYDEHEFHGSARSSRISVLVEGTIDPWQKVAGYYESDFLGVAGSNAAGAAASNYNQTNGWPPRLRQAHLTYDNSSWGFHFLAGQAWSLLTQNQVGITPRKENIPNTIEANYVVGWNYTRQWQIRAVQEFGPGVSLGVSIENPAAIVGATTATAPTGAGGAFVSGGIVNGIEVNFANIGAGGFLNGVTVTTDQIPDIIEKVAFDPGWGHYEIVGLQRFFTDHTLTCVPGPCVAGSTAMTGSTTTKTTFGAGVGGSVLLPLIPQYLDFTGNVLYGRGVGRYAPGQLPDVTIASDGSLTPLVGLSALVGLIAHPWEGLDVYAYAGLEQVSASYFDVGTMLFGYGNPGFSNVGCTIVTPSSFAGVTPANCIANSRRLSDVTVGFWQDVYRGNYGRARVGAQYEYIKREVFAGLGGAPSTDNNIILTSLRYYPFEQPAPSR
jgi:hypothetical protein